MAQSRSQARSPASGSAGVVAAGDRRYRGIATGLALDESRTTPSGVTISVYRPTGRPEFGSAEVT